MPSTSFPANEPTCAPSQAEGGIQRADDNYPQAKQHQLVEQLKQQSQNSKISYDNSKQNVETHTHIWSGSDTQDDAVSTMIMRHKLFPLPPIPNRGDIRTLGEHIASGTEIRTRCTNTGCNHTVRLNLVVVARYLGRDHSAFAEDIKPYFYCPKCRANGLADDNITFSYYSCTAPHSDLDDRDQTMDAHRSAA